MTGAFAGRTGIGRLVCRPEGIGGMGGRFFEGDRVWETFWGMSGFEGVWGAFGGMSRFEGVWGVFLGAG